MTWSPASWVSSARIRPLAVLALAGGSLAHEDGRAAAGNALATDGAPSGIRVLEYGAYDLNDTEGLPLRAEEDGSYTPDFAKLKNYFTHPVKVAAGKESNVFYLAKMKITAPPKDTARECRFEYEQGGRVYAQTLDCELELKVSE
jgi:hypothetical protein